MFGPLFTLFAHLRRRRDEDAEFIRFLDARRTVLFDEMIADVKPAGRLALLAAPWFEAPRFTARINAACHWLDGVTRAEGVAGWSGIPLIFMQAGSDAEDAAEHTRLLEIEKAEEESLRLYANRFANLPPGVNALHTHTKISSALRGRFPDKDLHIPPLFIAFTSDGAQIVCDQASQFREVKGRLLGYRLTDVAALLQVTPPVATDYFARIVVHDLCHGFLPPTPSRLEGFHNVVSLEAMGRLQPVAYRNEWERFVHAECTDPFFCFRAGREIEAVRRSLEPASPLQEDFLDSMAKWYTHPQARQRRVAYWDLPLDASEGLAIRIMTDRIRFAKNDGFRLYVRHMKRS